MRLYSIQLEGAEGGGVLEQLIRLQLARGYPERLAFLAVLEAQGFTVRYVRGAIPALPQVRA